jgi:two-component system, NtrC family, sensor kinase
VSPGVRAWPDSALSPVLSAIARTAARLCEASDALIYVVDGDHHRLVAKYGHIGAPQALGDTHPIRRDTPLGLAVIDRRPIHVPDISRVRRRFSGLNALHLRVKSVRTILAMPLVRDGVALGGVVIRRRRVHPFSPKQISLLTAFADQAAIALENARLSEALEGRNRELTEALEQQTATAEMLGVISGSLTDIQPVFHAMAESTARLCDSPDVSIFRVDGDLMELVVHRGPIPSVVPLGTERISLERGTVVGRSVIERRIIQVADLSAEVQEYPEGAARARRFGSRATLCVPLLKDGIAIGAIAVRRTEARLFSERQVALLKTFADQAVIAVENVRLFSELQARNRDLATALEQQTATAEILHTISRSYTDVQPVFQAIVDSAARLLSGHSAVLSRIVDDRIDLAAYTHTDEAGDALLESFFPVPLHSSGSDIRPIRDRVIGQQIPYNVADVETDPRVGERGRASARARGYRSQLVVPMLRDRDPIGTLAVTRREPGAFTGEETALLQTFADQAVIAIENVRLFKELKTRTEELTRSVQQLTALGEVGQAVSSTLDLETVLTTIASRASQLAGTDTCSVYEYDEEAEEFHLRATHNIDERVLELTRVRPLRKGEGVGGRVAETRKPVQIEDVAREAAYFGPLREALLTAGVRSVLAIPLLREDRLTGMLIVSRKAPGRFADEVTMLLQTFATQSAIAIQNARLYRELEARGRELEAASRHKSQFLANMSHEFRTPMNAILGYTELITDGIYGGVPEPMRDVLTRVDASGRHLLGLINDVLDLSKIEAGQLTLTLADYSMKEVVDAVVDAVEALAAAKGLRLTVDLAPDLPTGRGDQQRLAQVLLNLVGNAIKFTEQGQITIRVGAAAGLFTAAVSDSGPGVAIADQERIFEEFQQANTATTRPQGGTGLGLAIARRIVALHGGRIWVESVPGEGATFRFTLPIRVEQQAVLRTAAS